MVFNYKTLLLSFVVLSVEENGGDFGDTLWLSDETVPNDGVCDGEA
jgi:hypothetical protein